MQNGDIITATARILPLINHYGVYADHPDKGRVVFHNTSENGVHESSYDEFFKGRKLLNVRHSPLSGSTYNKIKALSQSCERGYNALMFNCYQYKQCVIKNGNKNHKTNNTMKTPKIDKQQLFQDSLAIVIGVTIAILLAQKLS